MAKEEMNAAFHLVMSILGGAVGGLIIMVVGNRLRGASDAAMKRKRFRSYLAVLRAKIESKAASEFVFSAELREASKLEVEALEVRHLIQSRLIDRFDAALRDYKATRFDQWAGPDQKRQQETDATNESAKRMLIDNLDRLSRCAWWMA